MKSIAKRIHTTRLFGPLSVEQLTHLLESSDVKTAKAGEQVIRMGESSNAHLILIQGEMRATKKWQDADKRPQEYSWIIKADGEEGNFASLVASKQVQASAISNIEYMLINADRVDELLGWTQQIANIMELRAEHKDIIATMKEASVFHTLPLDNIKSAIERVRSKMVEAGDVIMKQGEKGERYYMIDSGNADVHQEDPFSGETRLVNKMAAGDAFGEESLVQDGFSSATVTMTTPGKLYVLDKEDFNQLIKPGLVSEIQAAEAMQMVEQGKAKWLDCRYEIEYEESRIPGAPLIPLDRLRKDTHQLDANEKYVVYCRSGRRSKAAAFILRERNIDAISLAGGIKNWPFEIDNKPIEEN